MSKENEQKETIVKKEENPVNQLPIFLVITKNEALAVLISEMILKHFDTEIEAIIPYYDSDQPVVEKITDFIAGYENEQVIVFNSIIPVNKFGMHTLNNVFAQTENGWSWDYNVKTPFVMERAKIVELLEDLPGISDDDFMNAYFNKFHAQDLPIVLDWRKDTFTLPVVSENPSDESLRGYMNRKRWYWVSDSSVEAVLKFFNEG